MSGPVKANVTPEKATGDEKKDAAFADPRIRQRTRWGVNYAACFIMLAKGATFRQISSAWDIDFKKLINRAADEDWNGLIRRHGEHFDPPPPMPEMKPEEVEKKVAKITENRERTISLTVGLMEQIQKIITTAKESNTMLDPGSITKLAQAVKMLGEISMIAHGDEYVLKHHEKRGPKTGNNNGPLITISMPAIVAIPRRVKQIRSVIEEAQEELEGDDDEDQDLHPAAIIEGTIEEDLEHATNHDPATEAPNNPGETQSSDEGLVQAGPEHQTVP